MAIPILSVVAPAIILTPAMLHLLRLTKPGIIRCLGIAAIGVVFIMLFTFLFNFLHAKTIDYGFDVNPSEVPYFEIPADASEISYYSKFGSIPLVAQFRITEDGFREWMENKGETPERIRDPVDVTTLTLAEEPELKSLEVKSGYRWDSYDNTDGNDSGTIIVFDETSDRVYVRISPSDRKIHASRKDGAF